MKSSKLLFILFSFLFLSACQIKPSKELKVVKTNPIFEQIDYFKYVSGQILQKPSKKRITYYFDNGRPHRWIELDSTGSILTDYIYQYDTNWVQTGAKYIEPEQKEYASERVTFLNDTTQVTEWLDSIGNVYYKMIDNLNENGKTYRAIFIGDTTHGYDSTFYTNEGFEKRIFFTNLNGKVYNDRMFQYDSINQSGEWLQRKKIFSDSIVEIQKKEISYYNNFFTKNEKFYQGVISTGESFENTISFSADKQTQFFTRYMDWDKQIGYIAKKTKGLFTLPEPVEGLDTIYNGAISPSGKKLLFSKRKSDKEEIWLMEKEKNRWLSPKNLSKDTSIEGGYFYWLNESEIYFYIPENNGDLVVGNLENGQLKIKHRLSTLNTKNGTEFSPFVDKQKRFLIFTRYLEGNKSQQGFFISYNKGDFNTTIWSKPERIEQLPYGWGANISKDLTAFYYTDGDDLFKIRLNRLNLTLKD